MLLAWPNPKCTIQTHFFGKLIITVTKELTVFIQTNPYDTVNKYQGLQIATCLLVYFVEIISHAVYVKLSVGPF